MSAPTPRHRFPFRDPAADPTDPPPPPRDDLDTLLRQWHQDNAARAAAGRDRLLASLRHHQAAPAAPAWTITIRRFAPLAVAAVLALALVPLLFLNNKTAPVGIALAKADANIVLAPDGGRLDAFEPGGEALGPCVLKHTDVNAAVSGPFTRVTLTQKYHNPHRSKIEAVYTFPLSHDAAVDRMMMTVGDRVIIGEVKERGVAREIYEAARESGRVASLLEQERPNIFTQSVANIEPGVDIDITISYIERLNVRDGDFEFVFPTVVGPRFIPGDSAADDHGVERAAASAPAADASIAGTPQPAIPGGFQVRRGLTLLAPADIQPVGDVAKGVDTTALAGRLAAARPISPVTTADSDPIAALGDPVSSWTARYPDGSEEPIRLFAADVGEVGGRWFWMPPPAPGAPFAESTGQVPDAHRITPTPTRPETRAGHDLSISVTIDTGGPGLVDITAPLHKVTRQDVRLRPDGIASRSTVTLASQSTIPNRDFVLRWRQSAPGVTESVFTDRTEVGDFFAVILQPPNRVDDAIAIPRELVFVLDTSGSMRGPPIEASKAVAQRMLGSMRPQDRFNVITFSGDTRVLWPEPRPISDDHRAEAIRFFDHRDGSGGTEMMTAIETALRPSFVPLGGDAVSPADLNTLPADGRTVTIRVQDHDLDSTGLTTDSVLTDGRVILDGDTDPPTTARLENVKLPRTYLRAAERHLTDDTQLSLFIRGRWTTSPAAPDERVFIADSTSLAEAPPVQPLRIVVFLTDGYVGNDHAILDAIRRHRGTTRVFSIGIGNSVNRYLLDGMARAGGGESDYVLIPPNNTAAADPAEAKQLESTIASVAERLHTRTRSPVLSHVTAEFTPGLAVADVQPPLDQLPDLFDVRPIVLLGRLTQPGSGAVTIRGQTVAGVWERTIPIKLTDEAPSLPTAAELGARIVPNLWARARIDELLANHLAELQSGSVPAHIKSQIVQIGETFNLMSPFTSFVAVDHQRITIDGQPTLVPIPIELPDSTRWEGFFGADVPERAAAEVLRQQWEAKREEESTRLSVSASAPTLTSAAPASKPAGGKRDGAVASRTDASPPPTARPTAAAPAASPPPSPAKEIAERTGLVPNARERSEPALNRARVADKQLRFSRLDDLRPSAAAEPASPEAGTPDLRDRLSTDTQTQNLAAETFFNNISRELEVSEALGQAPPDRLAVAAGANYIAQTARTGQLTAANRARELFLQRYPDDQLLNEVATIAEDPGLVAAGAPTGQDPPGRGSAGPDQSGASDPAAKRAAADAVPTSQVDQLARRAEQAATREQRLLRRLDPRLYEMLPTPTPNLAYQQQRSQQNALRNRQNVTQNSRQEYASRNIAQSGPEVLVSILLESLDEPTLEALKAAGFRLESRLDASNTVVGAIPIHRLEALALVDAVRRIEPVTLP